MDDTIRNLERKVAEGSVPVQALANALRRTGDEVRGYDLMVKDAQEALDAAKRYLHTAEGETQAAANARYTAIGGCLSCNGEGLLWTHYHDGDSYSQKCTGQAHTNASVGAVPHRGAESKLTEEEDARLAAAHDAVYQAEGHLTKLTAARTISRGDWVAYTNPKARAHFKTDAGKGDKVPVGTEGKVTWTGVAEFGVAYGRGRTAVERALVVCDDGTKFYTAVDNLTFLRPMTKLEQAEQDRKSNVSNGSYVRLKAKPEVHGRVFWLRDQGGRLRIGFKQSKRVGKGRGANWVNVTEPTWCFVTDVELMEEPK